MKLFSFAFCFISLYSSLLSQSTDTIRLDDVHIYSGLLEIRQKEALRSLSIITAEQISSSNVATLDEILRYIPGLEIQSRNLYGVQADFSIRGSTFNQVLVLLDGIRLNDPLTGHFSAYLPVTLSEISRIEVIRGPASIIYGPDAVGGVINIITRKAVLTTDSTRNVTIRTGGGQYELMNTDAGISGSYGKINYNSGVKFIASGGHPSNDGHKYDFRLRTATASVSFPLSQKWRFSFRTAIDAREFSAKRFYTISPHDSARESVICWWNHVNTIHVGKRSVSVIDLAMKRNRDEYVFNSLTPPNKHNTSQITAHVTNRMEINSRISLTTGIQSYYRSVVSNDRGDHSEIYGGIYGIGYISFPDKINVSGGMRIEFDPFHSPDLLPQLNFSYSSGIFTLRGLAGKTIRNPDFTERYISTNLSSLAPGRNLGNPYLLPEKSWSIEAGFGIKPLDIINFDMTLFNRYGYELIDYVLTPGDEILSFHPLIPDEKYFYAKNIHSLTTRGVEFIMNASHSLGKRGSVWSTMAYSFQKPADTKGEISKYISNQSNRQFMFNTRYSGQRLGLSMNGTYRQRNPAYAEALNLTLSSEYWLFGIQADYGIIFQKLFIELRVENLFNTRYSDVLGAELPGRWITGGIRYKKK